MVRIKKFVKFGEPCTMGASVQYFHGSSSRKDQFCQGGGQFDFMY